MIFVEDDISDIIFHSHVLAVKASEDGFTKSYWEIHSLHFTAESPIEALPNSVGQGTIHTAVHDHCDNHPKHSQRHLGKLVKALSSPFPQHTMDGKRCCFPCIVIGIAVKSAGSFEKGKGCDSD